MKYILLIAGLFAQLIAYSQSKDPIEVTSEIQIKLKYDIEKEVSHLKQKLEIAKKILLRSSLLLTLSGWRFMVKSADLDYRDFGMRDASYAAAKLYDSLLNKYYKKLLATLKTNDKKF